MTTIVEMPITEAGRDDLEEVRHLLSAANEEYRATLAPSAFDPYLDMVLDLDARFEVARVLVLRTDDRLLATVTYFPDAQLEGWGFADGVAGIRSMGVEPSARGRGLAVRLLDDCVARARAAGSEAIGLDTAAWLPDAIRLYERYGFVRDPELDMRAADIMAVPAEADYAALAYRLDLSRGSRW